MSRITLFLRHLSLKPGSFSTTARKIGYFMIMYFGLMTLTVVLFALAGIVTIVIPIIFIPLCIFLAYRFSQAWDYANTGDWRDKDRSRNQRQPRS